MFQVRKELRCENVKRCIKTIESMLTFRITSKESGGHVTLSSIFTNHHLLHSTLREPIEILLQISPGSRNSRTSSSVVESVSQWLNLRVRRPSFFSKFFLEVRKPPFSLCYIYSRPSISDPSRYTRYQHINWNYKLLWFQQKQLIQNFWQIMFI